MLIAKHFGAANYGDYAKVTAFVSLFYLLADFGFNAVFLQKEEAPKRFRDLLYTRAIAAAVLIVLVNLVAVLLPYNSQTGIGFSPFVRGAIALFSFTILTESILYSAFAAFQRKYLYARFMWATIIGSFTTLCMVGIFILSGFPLFWIFVGYLIGGVIEAGIAIAFTKEKVFPISLQAKFIKELIRETLPIALMLIFNLVYFRVDTILLSLFKSSTDVGLYDISYRVFDFLIALPLFLSNVLYPKLIENEKNNRNLKAMLVVYVFCFAVLGALVALPFWFGAPLLFSFIKPQLLPAVAPLRLLLVSLPIFFATNILQWILLAKKQQKYLALVYVLLTIVNIALNLVFIPSFGYVASAIITGIGEAIVLALFLWKVFSI